MTPSAWDFYDDGKAMTLQCQELVGAYDIMNCESCLETKNPKCPLYISTSGEANGKTPEKTKES